ncbi:M28 family peptidase [Nonomuraea typhae]|uniref:M28 family peptidase n=1 Tax=Nonomuraea typhae TaxID=2603600 RepID=A0ABW7YNT9_9ACTN
MRRRSVLAAVAGLAATAAMVINPAAATAPPGAKPQQSLTASDPQGLAATAADRAVASGMDELRKGADETYWRRAVTAGASGMFYVSYDRTYKGLPMVGGDAVVVTDSQGRVRDTTAATGPAPADLAVEPRISAERAIRVSKTKLSRVDAAGTPRLVVLAWGKTPKLAWETVVEGVAAGKPSKQHVFVDARTGKVADSYDLVRYGTGARTAKSDLGTGNGYYYPNVTIDTSQQSGTYRMVDTTRPNIQCGGQNGQPFTGPDDVWGNNSGTNLETACVDALFGVQRQWEMLRDWLGRNGINGNGGGFPARVGLNDVNAFWNGSYTNYGRSQDSQRQVVPIDVVAHEYGHAIFQTTPGGAGSGNENGGLNESAGDIFGALTEHYVNNPNDPPDYEVGEEVNLVGQGPIRYMYNPNRVGDPNCWSTSIPNTEVHAAAGPLNHWFYLLAEGSSPGGGKPDSPICSGGPSSVTGIGIQKAGKIFMGALGRKTSSWRYVNVRSASLAAAVELYGANSVECATTKAAWNAVSVPVQSGEPTCEAPNQDFSINTNPATGSVEAGQTATTQIVTQTTAGNAQTVNLTASGVPAGANATFNPTSVTSGNNSTLTVTTSSTTPQGTHTITVTGTGTTATHTATFRLTVGTGTVDPPDISLTNVKAHLTQFQTIATNNGGNRRSTGPGYTASLSYVEQKLQQAGYTVRRVACGSTCTSGAGPNLIADWPGGDENQVIMAGAHLDGVAAGPGINDNASGSSALLEVALTLAAQRPNMLKHVRFGWWSDEEQGLNGSEGYVASLSTAERQRIQVYHNYDMVGSPNGGYFINNINTTAAQHLKAFYDRLNLQPEENTEGANRSDDASFRNAGIATSGVAAGASFTKSQAQATKWGGTAGQAYDRCYHAACDTSANINDTIIDRASDAAAWAIWKLAVGDGNPPIRDFSMVANPASGTVQAGNPATTTINTQTTAGTAQTINFTGTTGLPPGANATFNPPSVTSGNNSTLTITTSASTPSGTYPVTITGVGETGTKTTVFTLTVTGDTGGRTFRNDTDYQIRDFTFIQSPVTSNATGRAQSPVTVTATSNHTCLEDLDIWLRGPSGAWHQIRAAGGTSCTPFGTRTWSVPVNQNAAGTWVLYIEDIYAQDQGVLDWWSIKV